MTATGAQATTSVPLAAGRWSLWRSMVMRGAGFAVADLLALGDPACRVAADAVAATAAQDGPPAGYEQFRSAFDAAARRATAALSTLVGQDRFREALLWQNRAVVPMLDAHLREVAAGGPRNKTRRRREAKLASYLQRYHAKNDTIGFFGPVGWASWDEQVEWARVVPGARLLARRAVYFEGWCIDALAVKLFADPAIRPWVAPRRVLSLVLDGRAVRRPLGPPAQLTATEAAVLAACTGAATAREIAVDLLWRATPGVRSERDVLRVLEALLGRGLIAWSLEPPMQAFPERTLRDRLARIGDPEARERALSALGRLEGAKEAVAAAAGSAARVDAALAALEREFVRSTGQAPTRAAGESWAGRTLVYEDCQRDLDARLGTGLLDSVAGPLALVLDSARWLTWRIGEHYRAAIRQEYDRLAVKLGEPVVPFGRLFFEFLPMLLDRRQLALDPIVQELQRRWWELLASPAGQRRAHYATAELAGSVARAFQAPRPGWAASGYHSPDLMLPSPSLEDLEQGRYEWVLGELHIACNALDQDVFVLQHDDPAALLRAAELDIAGERFVPAYPKGFPYIKHRNHPPPYLVSERYTYLSFADDGDGVPARIVPITELTAEADGQGVAVSTRDGRRHDALDVLGDFVTLMVMSVFDLLPPLPHTPRVTVDRLVVARETWRVSAAQLPLRDRDDEADRFLHLHHFAREHRMPRFVFVKVPTEPKPLYLDLASPPLVNLAAMAVRDAQRRDPDELVVISEMLPAPGHAWLTDASGRRYTSEFRRVAVDGAEEPTGLALVGPK